MVRHQLPKLAFAGSSPVTRSNSSLKSQGLEAARIARPVQGASGTLHGEQGRRRAIARQGQCHARSAGHVESRHPLHNKQDPCDGVFSITKDYLCRDSTPPTPSYRQKHRGDPTASRACRALTLLSREHVPGGRFWKGSCHVVLNGSRAYVPGDKGRISRACSYPRRG